MKTLTEHDCVLPYVCIFKRIFNDFKRGKEQKENIPALTHLVQFIWWALGWFRFVRHCNLPNIEPSELIDWNQRVKLAISQSGAAHPCFEQVALVLYNILAQILYYLNRVSVVQLINSQKADEHVHYFLPGNSDSPDRSCVSLKKKKLTLWGWWWPSG